MGFEYYNEGNILLDDYHAIYFFIPKVACSSLKAVCMDILNVDRNEFDVHQYDYPCAHRADIASVYKEYFKYAFVRNPWDRLVSCYRNKIRQDRNYNSGEFRDGVFIKLLKYKVFRAGMSFDEFAAAVCEIPDNIANPHFRSQHTFITDNDGELIVNFVGKFENLNTDFKKVASKLDLKALHLPHLMTSGNNENYTSFYSSKTREMVRERYAMDISMFRYEKVNGL